MKLALTLVVAPLVGLSLMLGGLHFGSGALIVAVYLVWILPAETAD